MSNGSCLPCVASCSVCSGPTSSSTDCSLCADGYIVDDKGNCAEVVTSGTSSSQFVCPMYSSYSQDLSLCICNDRMIMNSVGACIELINTQCPSGTYSFDTGCLSCYSPPDDAGTCDSCTGPNKGECQLCWEGYYL